MLGFISASCRMSCFNIAAFAAAAVAVAGCARTGDEATTGHGVLVIVVDAMRADHLSGYGYDRETMPHLEELARDGVTFANAWSTGPGMIPAHISLLTGCDSVIGKPLSLPNEDGTLLKPLFPWLVPAAVPRVAQSFLAAGWTTAAFVDHPQISGLRGFEQGFRDYFDFGESGHDGTPLLGFRGVGLRFVEWLRARDKDENWFAYVHIRDLERVWEKGAVEGNPVFEPRPELSAVPPTGQRGPVFFAVPTSRWTGPELSLGEYEALYDTALFQLDWNLENLFRHVERAGWWRNTTVAVAGSYGIGFGESGLILDTGTLSDVDLHVPVIVRPELDMELERGRVLDQTMSLVDLAPTLLGLVGIEPPAGMHGISLAGAIRNEPGPEPEPHRRFAFAAGALPGEFAVMDVRYCYERSRPGSGGRARLSASWYGDEASHRGEVREVLHDRLESTGPGHLGLGVVDPERALFMRQDGEEWYALMNRARAILHPHPWAADAVDEGELAELQELGVIGPLVGSR